MDEERVVWIRFALAVLATWRVTHLLTSEDGPADLVVRLRARLGEGFAGDLMDCFRVPQSVGCRRGGAVRFAKASGLGDYLPGDFGRGLPVGASARRQRPH